MVGRLAEQKGIDLVAAILPRLAGLDVQLAVLGSGERSLEHVFVRASRERTRGGWPPASASTRAWPTASRRGRTSSSCPRRFEPCGLNQMYSLRYGTVPLVHAVGGLEDTVVDFDEGGRGTGFKFREYSPRALWLALLRAVDVYRDGFAWEGLVQRGMSQDFSWQRSAQSYEALYQRLVG